MREELAAFSLCAPVSFCHITVLYSDDYELCFDQREKVGKASSIASSVSFICFYCFRDAFMLLFTLVSFLLYWPLMGSWTMVGRPCLASLMMQDEGRSSKSKALSSLYIMCRSCAAIRLLHQYDLRHSTCVTTDLS